MSVTEVCYVLGFAVITVWLYRSWKIRPVFLMYGRRHAGWPSDCIFDNQTGNMMAIVLQMHGLEEANCAETH